MSLASNKSLRHALLLPRKYHPDRHGKNPIAHGHDFLPSVDDLAPDKMIAQGIP